MSYAVQKATGTEQNKLYEKDTAIHDWYRFVLSFPPHLVRQYIKEFSLRVIALFSTLSVVQELL